MTAPKMQKTNAEGSQPAPPAKRLGPGDPDATVTTHSETSRISEQMKKAATAEQDIRLPRPARTRSGRVNRRAPPPAFARYMSTTGGSG